MITFERELSGELCPFGRICPYANKAPLCVWGGGAPQVCMQCSCAVSTLVCLVRGATELRMFTVVTIRANLIGAVGCCELWLRSTPLYQLLRTGVAFPEGMPMWDLSGIWLGFQVARPQDPG